MNEFLKMDIFFSIASVAVIILSVLIIILLVYLIKVVKNIKYISDKARIETDNLSHDIQILRHNIHSEGFKIKHLLNFFGSIIKRKKKGR
jgi:uncharacterized protein YoxC